MRVTIAPPGLLTDLRYLNLKFLGLVGTVPTEIRLLSNLVFLCVARRRRRLPAIAR